MSFKIIPNEQTPKVFNKILPIEIENNRELYNEFLLFASQHDNAVGLAANQCSFADKRFMHNLFALRDLKTNKWKLIINPQIILMNGMVEQKLEGCLTWVGKLIIAERSRAIDVVYKDIDNNVKFETLWGFPAQIWQHEVNHLLGVEEQVVDRDYKLPVVKSPERNDKCPCMSGRKYKHCCLKYLD
jgi:peptide deformylase